MSEQVLIEFTVDKDLMEKASEVCEKLGLDLPTALLIFLEKTKIEGRIPFDV